MLGRAGLAVVLLGLSAPAAHLLTLGAVRAAEPEEGAAPLGEGTPPASTEPMLEETERPDEAPAEGESPAAIPSTGSKASKRGKAARGRNKRKGHTGWLVTEDKLRKRLPPPPSGNLYLHRPVERESLKVNIYNPDGSYNVDAVKAASHMLRCKRTDTEREMEPRLLAILSHVFDHFGERRIDVISGYRNQRKTTSYHYKGSAADVRIEGVPARKLKAFVETLDAGGMGIGIYPVTGFVHIDVRPPPSYRWIDYAKSNPDALQKKPPRWFKKKRLQS